MEKRNYGCFVIATIWAISVTGYYIFIFDYEKKSFSWLDSIIALSALGVLISALGNFPNDEKK